MGTSVWGPISGRSGKIDGNPETQKPTFLFLNIADAHRPWQAVPNGLDWIPETVHTEHSGKSNPNSEWRRFIEGRMDEAEEGPYLERVINNYDYAVWRADQVLGQVLQHLDESGFCADRGCRIVITSDHGEMLGEHQLLDHGHYVWQNNVAVPLIYKNVGPTEPLPSPIDAIYAHHLAKDGQLPDELERPRSEGWPLCVDANGLRILRSAIPV